MQSRQFAKVSVNETWVRQVSAPAQPAAVLSAELQQAVLRLCHSNQCKILATLQLSQVHLGDVRLLIRVQNKITAFSLNL